MKPHNRHRMQVQRYPLPEEIASLADTLLDALKEGGEVSFGIDETGRLSVDDTAGYIIGTIRGPAGPDMRGRIIQYIVDTLAANVVATAPYQQ